MDPAWVFVAFIVIMALVAIVGTPYRGAPRRGDAPAAPQQPPAGTQQTVNLSQSGRPITQGGQTFFPPPPPGHRYVIGQDGQLKAVRN